MLSASLVIILNYYFINFFRFSQFRIGQLATVTSSIGDTRYLPSSRQKATVYTLILLLYTACCCRSFEINILLLLLLLIFILLTNFSLSHLKYKVPFVSRAAFPI